MTGPALLLEVPCGAASLQTAVLHRLAAMALGGAATVIAAGSDGETGVHVTLVAFPAVGLREAFRTDIADLVASGLVIRPLALKQPPSNGPALLFP
ncbi:hypothetical protein ACJ4V0_18800 [Phreatobacter sp. HK31-P]